jgi:tetrahydromethanopterin S-methyltransferase subunit F
MKNGYINEYKSFYNAYNNEIEVIKTHENNNIAIGMLFSCVLITSISLLYAL